MRVALLYIPGLGDSYDRIRQTALRYWRNDDITTYFVAMKWSRKVETFEQKYQRVMEVVHLARQHNDRIILIGESAGGAMALYSLLKATGEIDQAVTLCGYNHGAAGLAAHYKITHPAFYELMPHVDEMVASMPDRERNKIMTIYSRLDRTVTPSHTLIVGTRVHAISIPGHLFSILWMLITKMPLRVLKLGV